METESDANYIEDLMNMSMNLDRLPKEMMASVSSSYPWEGRKSHEKHVKKDIECATCHTF